MLGDPFANQSCGFWSNGSAGRSELRSGPRVVPAPQFAPLCFRSPPPFLSPELPVSLLQQSALIRGRPSLVPVPPHVPPNPNGGRGLQPAT